MFSMFSILYKNKISLYYFVLFAPFNKKKRPFVLNIINIVLPMRV